MMERLDITVLDREYSLACAPDQKEGLLAAVRHVDQRMQAIKEAGKITGNERIAVMASIQIAVELLSTRAPGGVLGDAALGEFKTRIDTINQLIDKIPGT